MHLSVPSATIEGPWPEKLLCETKRGVGVFRLGKNRTFWEPSWQPATVCWRRQSYPLFGVCRSKKRDSGHKMSLRGSNPWRRGLHSGALEQDVQRDWAGLYAGEKETPFQPKVIH